MLLLIDNYDSFTYNLVQCFQMLGQKVLVFEHDQIDLTGIREQQPNYLVISPGPNSPKESGISLQAIQQLQEIPILGICLGHQCLAHAFGADIIEAPEIMHGKTSLIHHRQINLFSGLNHPFFATRYHSLTIAPETLPTCFSIDAWTDDHTIMAISHRQLPLFGLQFHPEAILSEHGSDLLQQFLKIGHERNS